MLCTESVAMNALQYKKKFMWQKKNVSPFIKSVLQYIKLSVFTLDTWEKFLWSRKIRGIWKTLKKYKNNHSRTFQIHSTLQNLK